MSQSESRWKPISKTSPSGKTMFVCMSCGQTSVTPELECRNRTTVYVGGVTYYIPCSIWPMTPDEYIHAKMLQDGTSAYFSGTVRLPDDTKIEVTAPIPEEVAKQIACIQVEYDLRADQRKTQLLRREREFREELTYKGELEAPSAPSFITADESLRKRLKHNK